MVQSIKKMRPRVAFAITLVTIKADLTMKRFFIDRILFGVIVVSVFGAGVCDCIAQDFGTGSASVERGFVAAGDALPLPFENDSAIEVENGAAFEPPPQVSVTPQAPLVATSVPDCDVCRGTVVTDPSLFPEVKNVNFFGVDREACCDEWSRFCDCKTPNYGCKCGGLKSNPGHLGIAWLRNKFGADACESCESCRSGRCQTCERNRIKKRNDKHCQGRDSIDRRSFQFSFEYSFFNCAKKQNCQRCNEKTSAKSEDGCQVDSVGGCSCGGH
jgi:hypothetical protein